jgi:hypothetical protein
MHTLQFYYAYLFGKDIHNGFNVVFAVGSIDWQY